METISHELWMKRCIELAKMGLGKVQPNPMVGAVIVYHNQIIGEGFHQRYGEAHAEINAINSVKDPSLLKKSTIYVSLEPCSHFGKTPPCADKLIELGFPKVVVGCSDPHDKVNGKGISKLQNAGIEVVTNVLHDECQELNKRFFTFHQKKRPYIILKWAQTLDGFIDKERNDNEPHINWITDEKTRMLVHRWRSEEQAILTGTNTILLDDPQLTVREWQGKNPLRLVIDEKLVIPETAKVFDKASSTLIFNAIKSELKGNLEFVKIDFTENVFSQILLLLYKRNILSLIVEGGRETLQSFIDAGLWDEARVFSGNCFFFSGTRAPEIKGKLILSERIGEDNLSFIVNP